MEKLLIDKRSAAQALGVSVRTLEGLIARKEIMTVRIGRRRLVRASSLTAFCRRDHPTLASRREQGATKIPASSVVSNVGR